MRHASVQAQPTASITKRFLGPAFHAGSRPGPACRTAGLRSSQRSGAATQRETVRPVRDLACIPDGGRAALARLGSRRGREEG
jgi:hypothetical protein